MEGQKVLDQRDRMREYLEQYRKLGFPIISVLPGDKKPPMEKGWQQEGELTQEMIEEMSSRDELPNVGLVLGSRSGIVRLDVDGLDALKKLPEICPGHLPETCTFETPSGGYGFLFRVPPEVNAKNATLWKGEGHSEVVFMGEGHYSMMPPSILSNGGMYQWVQGKSPAEIEIAYAPDWVLDKMCNAQGVKKANPSPKTSDNPSDSEAILERLSKRCSRFAEAKAAQEKEGLNEDSWFLWESLITNAGFPEAALAFSKLSGKHDERSESRIRKMAEKVGVDGGPMIRCTSFGCAEDDVRCCFNKVRKNDADEITNSPGTLIKSGPPEPPIDPAYAPYVEALKQTDYQLSENGGLCVRYDDEALPIANFVARVVGEIVRDNGVDQTKKFDIVGMGPGGCPFHRIQVDASDFPMMNWPLNHWGIAAIIKPGLRCKDYTRDAIQSISLNAPRHMVYTHLGWRKRDNGKWVYLHSGGAVGADDVSVEIENGLDKYCLPVQATDIRKAAEASLRLLNLAPHRVTLTLLPFMYLAPLTDPLGRAGISPNFVYWLYGGTGTRKTSIAKLFMNHYGRFANPPCTFNDTANSIEKRTFLAKDNPLFVDDFHPCASAIESMKMNQLAQKIVRMVGDGIGRGRMKPNTELQKEYPPRGLVLVTGEDLISGSSTLARTLNVKLEKKDVNLKLLSEAQKNAHLLGEAMVGYLEWLIPQMDDLPGRLLSDFEVGRDFFQSRGGHGRTGEISAWLSIAVQIMLQFMTSVGACPMELANQLQSEAKEILVNLIEDQKELNENENPPNIFAKVLLELLTSKRARVEPLDKGLEDDPFIATAGELIGYFDETFFYLFPQVSYSVINRFLASRNERIPVSETILWRQMDDADMIKVEVGRDGRRQFCPKKMIPRKKDQVAEGGQRPRLLHLYRDAIENIDEAA